MDSPASSPRKARQGRKVCKKCQRELELTEFYRAGNNSYTVRSVCKECHAKRVYDDSTAKRLMAEPCYFCDKPPVYLTYCADHWQQYREEHLKAHPEFAKYLQIVSGVAEYFDVSAALLLYGTSQRAPYVHMRTVAMLVLKNLTNLPHEKMAVLFTKNISNSIRGVQRGERLYALYPDFAADVDGVLRHLTQRGLA